eukprot:2520622-Rhodomonas_salina.1
MEYQAVPGKLCSRAVRRLIISVEVMFAWIHQPWPISDHIWRGMVMPCRIKFAMPDERVRLVAVPALSSFLKASNCCT